MVIDRVCIRVSDGVFNIEYVLVDRSCPDGLVSGTRVRTNILHGNQS